MSKVTSNFGIFGLPAFRRKDMHLHFSNEKFSSTEDISVEPLIEDFKPVVAWKREFKNLEETFNNTSLCIFGLSRFLRKKRYRHQRLNARLVEKTSDQSKVTVPLCFD